MRRLRHYSARDWARLRPLTQAYKSTLYQLADRRLSRRKARGEAEALARLGRNPDLLLATIAFEAPWAIDWQLRAMKAFMPGPAHLVADNSRDAARAAEIEAVCARWQVPYLRLPPNPEHNPSRSHGMAMNWVFRHVVAPLAPRRFGFLDHDLIPFQPTDIGAVLDTQPVYGQLQQREWGWYPWAGYCFFDLDRLGDRAFDFRPDWFYRLDTGGRNHRAFLGALDADEFRWARLSRLDLVLDGSVVAADLLGIDGFFHIGNASLYDRAGASRIAMLERLSTEDALAVIAHRSPR